MRLRVGVSVAACAVILFSTLVEAGRKEKPDFEFDPVTHEDWSASSDSLCHAANAVMIFEKIEVDETELVTKDKVYVSLYRRIRILSSHGREHGDVAIPYLHESQELLQASGRVITEAGDTAYLTRDMIRDKDVLETQDLRIRQLSFSMPGLSDDCILEFHLLLRIKSMFYLWAIQKEVPLLLGELRWKFYNGKGMSERQYAAFSSVWTHAYLLDSEVPTAVTELPSLNEPEEIVFTVRNVAPFEPEPWTMPERCIKNGMRIYYGHPEGPEVYWANLVLQIPKLVDDYIDGSKRLRNLAERFEILPTIRDKALAAYSWLCDSMTNVACDVAAYDTDKIKKRYSKADKAMKHRIADPNSINMMYCGLLREMNIDARFIYAIDRHEDVLLPEVETVGFHRSLVSYWDDGNVERFCAPGELFMPFECVPWYNEGVKALEGGTISRRFITIPISSSADNLTVLTLKLTLDNSLRLSGELHEEIAGHRARAYRIEMNGMDTVAQFKHMIEQLEGRFSRLQIDSLTVENSTDADEPLVVHAKLRSEQLETNINGERLMLAPLDFARKIESPFTSDERKYDVVFEYPEEVRQMVSVELPNGWAVLEYPRDTLFHSVVGDYGLSCRVSPEGFSLQSSYKLHSPFFERERYDAVKTFFDQCAVIGRATVLLTRSDGAPLAPTEE